MDELHPGFEPTFLLRYHGFGMILQTLWNGTMALGDSNVLQPAYVPEQ